MVMDILLDEEFPFASFLNGRLQVLRGRLLEIGDEFRLSF